MDVERATALKHNENWDYFCKHLEGIVEKLKEDMVSTAVIERIAETQTKISTLRMVMKEPQRIIDNSEE